jgi:hypothetical protein
MLNLLKFMLIDRYKIMAKFTFGVFFLIFLSLIYDYDLLK